MSLTLKLASLAIRTLAKPVGNRIKSRAREHDTFRAFFVNFAQRLHRVDMRMRLGILHDAAVQERMHAREAAEAATKKKKDLASSQPAATLRTDQQSTSQAETEGNKDKQARKEKPAAVKIRPLTEARAIELGANFASETFIFVVAAGLIIFERWWSKRKDNKRDEHVVDRLEALESQTKIIAELRDEIQQMRNVSNSSTTTVPSLTESSKSTSHSSSRTAVVPDSKAQNALAV